MKFKYDFIPQGSKVTREGGFLVCKDRFTDKKWQSDRVVVLDTGNALETGIVDHHQPDSPFMESCVASIIANHPEQYLKHLKNQEEVTIVTHYAPDLDALGAVYFTQKYLLGTSFSPADKVLSEYILEVDSGKLSIDPDYPISIASIWLVITNSESVPPFQMDNEGLIRKGIALFEAVSELLLTNNNPWDINLLNNLEGFDVEKQGVMDDKAMYAEDLNTRSEFGVVKLHNADKGGMDNIDCILTDGPKSKLWKYWVRGDRKNSSMNEGFICTCAFWDRRAIVAIDPNTPYNLKGLGLLVDRLEVEELLKSNSKEVIENGEVGEDGKAPGPRPGFHRNDPWYDGRGFHNFTIIDAPRAGSSLSNDQIKRALFSEDCWSSYSDAILVNKDLSLDDLLELDLPTEVSCSEIALNIDFELSTELFEPGNLDKFRKSAKSLLNSPKLNFLDRKKAFDLQMSFANDLVHWLAYLDDKAASASRDIIVELAIDVLTPEILLKVLNDSRNLDPMSFCSIIQSAEPAIRKDNLFSVVLSLQDKHPEAFSLENIQLIENALNSNGIDSAELLCYMNFISMSDDESSLFEELPVYGFNKLKNYIDDLLVCENLNSGQVSQDIFTFTANDFEAFFGEETDVIKLEDSLSTLSVLKSSFFKTFFGEGSESILKSRMDLLEVFKGNTAKLIKRYSTNQLFVLSYQELKEYIEELQRSISSETHKKELLESAFYESLVLISEFSALEYLYSRVGRFYRVRNNARDISNYESSPFVEDFNSLIIHLFKLISLYPNSTSIEAVEDEIENAKELLANLRIKAAKFDFIKSEGLRESIGEFLSMITDEIHMNVSEVQGQTKHALAQYNLLSSEEGIIAQVAELPFFYRTLLFDVFYSFKRYYRERVIFFRNELGYVVDLNFIDNELDSNSDFISFYNKLINESIKFDWQELKDNVDSSDDPEIIKAFYDKYFNWQLLNIRDEKEQLNELNSKIRFAEGESKKTLKDLVLKLPSENNIDNYEDYIRELAFKWDINDVVTHFPVYLIHNSYDFILDTYISKFDVDNVKDSLKSFSTSFPWYYRWFTNKNVIQGIFLLICFLLLAVGFFDTTVYDLEGETFRSPIAKFLSDSMGMGLFTIIAKGLHVFWGLLLSLAFTLPLCYGVYAIVKRYFLKEDTDDQDQEFKFIQLVGSIEGKRSSLLYLSFILPLLLVVIQMASPDTISMINNIEGIRLISTLTIIIGLTMLSVYLSVKEKNDNRPRSWIINKTKHMFWLHLLQAILLTVFVIDLLLRFELSYEMFPTKDELLVMGISKYIEIDFGFFDFRIMPVFSILVSFLTLFFSFFIDKVIGGGEE